MPLDVDVELRHDQTAIVTLRRTGAGDEFDGAAIFEFGVRHDPETDLFEAVPIDEIQGAGGGASDTAVPAVAASRTSTVDTDATATAARLGGDAFLTEEAQGAILQRVSKGLGAVGAGFSAIAGTAFGIATAIQASEDESKALKAIDGSTAAVMVVGVAADVVEAMAIAGFVESKLGIAGVYAEIFTLAIGTGLSLIRFFEAEKERNEQLVQARAETLEFLSDPLGNGESYLLADVDVDQVTDEALAYDIVTSGSGNPSAEVDPSAFARGLQRVGNGSPNTRHAYLLSGAYTDQGSTLTAGDIEQMFKDGVLVRDPTTNQVSIDLTMLSPERLARGLRAAASDDFVPSGNREDIDGGKLFFHLGLLNGDLSLDPTKSGKPVPAITQEDGNLFSAAYGVGASFDRNDGGLLDETAITQAIQDGVLTFNSDGFFTIDRSALPTDRLVAAAIAGGSKEQDADWLGIQRGLQRLGFDEQLSDEDAQAIASTFGTGTGRDARVTQAQLKSAIESGALLIDNGRATINFQNVDPVFLGEIIAQALVDNSGVPDLDPGNFLDTLVQMGFDRTGLSDNDVNDLFDKHGTGGRVRRIDIEIMIRSGDLKFDGRRLLPG